jgi:hypothetical protein
LRSILDVSFPACINGNISLKNFQSIIIIIRLETLKLFWPVVAEDRGGETLWEFPSSL